VNPEPYRHHEHERRIPDQATRAQIAEKLRGFVTSAMKGIEHENDLWVTSRFAGDIADLAAAAERGDAKA